MFAPSLTRLVAWCCLVLQVATGVAPAGAVLCIPIAAECDGCVGCSDATGCCCRPEPLDGECDDHVGACEPAGPCCTAGCEEGSGPVLPVPPVPPALPIPLAPVATLAAATCPITCGCCVDVLLGSAPGAAVRSADESERHIAFATALPLAQTFGPGALRPAARRRCGPYSMRPPDRAPRELNTVRLRV